MYEIKNHEKLEKVEIIYKEKEKSLLGMFISDFDQTIYCELSRAVKKIKEGTLNQYKALFELYFFRIAKEGVFIQYDDNYGAPSQGNYSLEELEETMKIYNHATKEYYGKDLEIVTEDYEPLVEGIIDEDEIANKDRGYRFH